MAGAASPRPAAQPRPSQRPCPGAATLDVPRPSHCCGPRPQQHGRSSGSSPAFAACPGSAAGHPRGHAGGMLLPVPPPLRVPLCLCMPCFLVLHYSHTYQLRLRCTTTLATIPYHYLEQRCGPQPSPPLTITTTHAALLLCFCRSKLPPFCDPCCPCSAADWAAWQLGGARWGLANLMRLPGPLPTGADCPGGAGCCGQGHGCRPGGCH